MIEIPSRVLEGELVDDWYPLSGRQGDEREGVINLVLEYKVCFNLSEASVEEVGKQVVIFRYKQQLQLTQSTSQ